jgi:superfamily II DNA or RNA helicase
VEGGGARDVRILQAGAVVTGVVGNARVYIRRSNGKLEGECSCNERGVCVHVVAVSIAAERSASTTVPTPPGRLTGLAATARQLSRSTSAATLSVTPGASAGSGTSAASGTSATSGPAPAFGASTTTTPAAWQVPATNFTSAAALARQQRLCYLLTRSPTGGLQVAVWIGQDGAHPFSLRPPPQGSKYPRYVQPNDRDILRTLSTTRADGPQPLTGEAGHALLLQIVATGRAFWHSLRTPVLRTRPPRQVLFSWATLPNGDQQLRCEVSASVAVFLDLEPPLYIDSSTAEAGHLESPLPMELVREYWQRGPIAPEQVTATNAQIARYSAATSTTDQIARDSATTNTGDAIARDSAATSTTTDHKRHDGIAASPTRFPTLQTLPIEKRRLTSLTARLTLVQGPATILYYVYNDLPVDSGRLQDERATVRQMMDGVLYEIPRDHALERQFRARLEQLLPASPLDREAWLEFMLSARPALEAERWEVQVTDAFPYRIATPNDWYGDLDTGNRHGWFNLRLGVVVDGKEVNLLPALARYLQPTLANNQTSLPTDAITQAGATLHATPDATTPSNVTPIDTLGTSAPGATNSINTTSGLTSATAPISAALNSTTAGAPAPGDTAPMGAALNPTTANAPAPGDIAPISAALNSTTANAPAPNGKTTAASAPLGTAGCRVGEQWLVVLDDGRYLPIAIDRIQRIAHTLVELFDGDSLTKQQALALPKSHTSRVVQLARELNGPVLRTGTPELRALLDDLETTGGIQPLPAPEGFNAELRPYQQDGLGWLQFLRRHHLGGILADDMGLGKTVQTLAHLLLEKQQGRLERPSLIVAPVSTLGNWQQELHRFAPELRGLVLHGSRRRESFPLIDKVDVVITGYPVLQLDSDVLLARDYYLVILDEAQTIKNPRAKVSAVARSVRSEYRLALTGTPVENHLGELWSLFDFAQPGLLGEERHFQRHYRTPIEKDGNRPRAQGLAQRVAPFLLRRTKDAVAKDLPPKTEIVETLALDERQRDLYDGIRLASHRHIQEVVRQQGLARSQITILDALLKLRQACCDPRLLPVTAGKEDVPSAKLEWLASALPELIAEGRRVLLFSQFTSMLRLIETKVRELAIPYCLLTGETQNRSEVIARFQSGDAPLFLISLKAGGTGLNLTAADTVIHYDPWWNPAVEAQATDRAHRIGQDKPVFVYKLIAQGTVEERILQLQADKHALASRLYTESSGSPASLTPADIEALFAP